VTKTVLIADDSASVRLSVRLLLQGRHKEIVVREAFDGMDAIEKAKKSKPDLILLDLAMPRVNGAEAATVLKMICRTRQSSYLHIPTYMPILCARPSALSSFQKWMVFPSC